MSKTNVVTLALFTTIAICLQSVKSKLECEEEWFKFQSKCFWVNNTERVTRNENLRNCQAMNGDLVSVHSREENNFVRSLTIHSNDYWLGGYRVQTGSSQFEWSDGSEFKYTNWDLYQPDGLMDDQSNCTVMVSGFWYDFSCHTNSYQLCQKSILELLSGRSVKNLKLVKNLARELEYFEERIEEDLREKNESFEEREKQLLQGLQTMRSAFDDLIRFEMKKSIIPLIVVVVFALIVFAFVFVCLRCIWLRVDSLFQTLERIYHIGFVDFVSKLV